MNCKVCNNDVDTDTIHEEFDYLFEQADILGVQSLTENEQILYEWKICSSECFELFTSIVD